MANGDEIKGEVGDDSRNVAVGKDNEQRSNTVNNYINPTEREKREQQVDSYDRLARIEYRLNLVADFVIGSEERRRVGLVDQFDEYMKSDREWKQKVENRLDAAEGDGTRIFITPQVAILLTIIGGLALVVAFFLISWLSGSWASAKAIVPYIQALSSIIAHIQGRLGWTS